MERCPIARSDTTIIRNNHFMKLDKEGLVIELLTVVEARLVLTSNIWTNARLINDTLVFQNKLCITLYVYL